ncbi:MAG: hypothetical protein R3Y35_01825 [Clostridia bacterium]
MFKIKQKLIFVLLGLSLCTFTACTSDDEDFIDISLIVPEEIEYETTTAEIADYTDTQSTGVSIQYAYERQIYFEESGFFQEFYVDNGDYIESGDIIASYVLEVSAVTIAQKELQLESLEESYANAVSTYNTNLSTQKSVLESLEKGSYDYEIQSLNIEKLTSEHNQYKYTTTRSIEALEEEIAQLDADSEVQYLVAPYSGQITGISDLDEGDTVGQSIQAITLSSVNEYLVKLSDGTGFDWGSEVEIEIGNLGNVIYLTGTVICSADILSSDLSQTASYIQIDYVSSDVSVEEISTNIKNATATVTTVSLEDVLIIDEDAVTKYDGSYYVNVLEDGILKKRYISTIYSNNDYYCIEDGLTQEQIVVIE